MKKKVLRIVERKYNTGKVEYVIQQKMGFLCFVWWEDCSYIIIHEKDPEDGKPLMKMIYSTFDNLKEAQSYFHYFDEYYNKEIEVVISEKECKKEKDCTIAIVPRIKEGD